MQKREGAYYLHGTDGSHSFTEDMKWLRSSFVTRYGEIEDALKAVTLQFVQRCPDYKKWTQTQTVDTDERFVFGDSYEASDPHLPEVIVSKIPYKGTLNLSPTMFEPNDDGKIDNLFGLHLEEQYVSFFGRSLNGCVKVRGPVASLVPLLKGNSKLI